MKDFKVPDQSATYGLSFLTYFGGVQPKNMLNFEKNFDLTLYHLNMMFNKTNSMFEYGGDFGKGKSEKITKHYLEAITQTKGYSVILEKNGKLYATWGTLGGRPRYDYLPEDMIVNNPYIPINETLKIDKNCVFFKNDAFAWGLYPLNLYYATKLRDNDQSRRVLMIISRAMKLLHGNSTDMKDAFDKTVADLKDGKLAAMFDDSVIDINQLESLPFGESTSSQTFIQLLEDYQYNKGSWYNEVGVQSNYNMKRETITSSENILNVDSLLPLSDNMLECRKEQVEKINKMFGVEWTVDFGSAWKKVRREIQQKEDAVKAESGTQNKPVQQLDTTEKGDNGDENSNNE